jgi:DNA mismatch repair protein MutS2
LSNAFLIAEKLGISEKVLEAAHLHQNGSGEEIAQALEALERLKEAAEKEKLQASRMKEESGRERERLKKILETIKDKRLEIYSKAEEKARKAVQKIEEELKKWALHRKEENIPGSLQRKEIRDIRETFLPSIGKKGRSAIPAGLKVGERVKIEGLRSTGILTNVKEPLNRAEVLTDKAKVKAPLSQIIQATDENEKKGTGIPRDQPLLKGTVEEPIFQLNVIGLTVEDALPKVDKFIDQALLHGLEKVQIIHGVGTGRLRDAIGRYLNGHRAVKSLSSGETMKGGRGMTLVELG